MSRKGSRSCGRAVLALVTLLPAVDAGADSGPLPLTRWDAAALGRARTGAVRRLQAEECQKVLTDFTDAQGRPLQETLEERAKAPGEYVEAIPFIDGSRLSLCQKPNVYLVSVPGLPRVYVCKAFAAFELGQPGIAESMVIHEALHTLGLGENPPSSGEITARVEARCR
jgi:hypothetical protein